MKSEALSPAWRLGEWLYRSGSAPGGWCVEATWPSDDAPSWRARFGSRVMAERGAVALTTGKASPSFLIWEPIEEEPDVVGLAS